MSISFTGFTSPPNKVSILFSSSAIFLVCSFLVEVFSFIALTASSKTLAVLFNCLTLAATSETALSSLLYWS